MSIRPSKARYHMAECLVMEAFKPEHRPTQDVMRIAAQVRAKRASAPTSSVLVCPVSSGCSAAELVYSLAAALAEMKESPVLILNLAPPATRQAGHLMGTPLVEGASLEQGSITVAGLSIEQDALEFITSPEFKETMEAAQAQFAWVVVHSRSVVDSVEALVAADSCDAVILSVAAGRTTRSEMLAVSREFQRSKASVLGFALDR